MKGRPFARLSMLIVAAAGGLVGGFGVWPPLTPPAALAQAAPKKEDEPYYFGNDFCKRCHEIKTLAEAQKGLVSLAFTRGSEMVTWSEYDKHKDAMKVLDTEGKDDAIGKDDEHSKQMARSVERSRQMAKILGIKGSPQKDNRCVSCHGVLIEGGKDNFDETTFSEAKRADSGVSCVLCHGPHDKWVDAHSGVNWGKLWRGKTREDKAKLGLNDLWDPARRAELCCACHIGDAKAGKVVTHEMYAAGHPPLPGIEIAAFCDAMPRHWETWQEKRQRATRAIEEARESKIAARIKEAEGRSELYAAAFHFDRQPPETQQSELAIIGAVVAFRTSMRLIAAQASGKAGPVWDNQAGEEKAWPELAAFECYACHHDLKQKSWRQRRVTGLKPGRPEMRGWSKALVPLGVDCLFESDVPAGQGRRAELVQGLGALERAFTDQPFGVTKDVALRARQLEEWADKLLDDLERRDPKIDTAKKKLATAQKLLGKLAALPGDRLPDFDSARQMAWAFDSMAREIQPKLWDQKNARAALLGLQTSLELQLPEGQVTIVPQYLSKALRKIADYDPDAFQQQMRVLEKQVKIGVLIRGCVSWYKPQRGEKDL